MPRTPSAGYVMLLTLIFMGIFTTVAAAYLNSITGYAKSARYQTATAQALALADAGIDDALYQLDQSASYTGATTTLATGTYAVTVSAVGTNTKRLTVTAYVPNASAPVAIKTATVLLGLNTTFVSFHYGVQVGAGGVNFNNNSEVFGDLRSDGPISGSGTITGDAIAAGTSALSGVHVEGNAYAHSLTSCTIGGNAYYTTISSCSVTGTQNPGSADQPTEAMPISDDQIASWEATAAAGTTITGSHTINSSETLGPTTITGDLSVGGRLTLSGIVWVQGNVSFQNNATLTVASSTGNDGAILIAGIPSDGSKGSVSLSNNFEASGNGSPGSYPMILSTSSSTAISLGNNSTGVILYASRGTISVSNNAGANQITAYRLQLNNNATVTYISGLQNQGFSGGPGGSWAVVPHTYEIAR